MNKECENCIRLCTSLTALLNGHMIKEEYCSVTRSDTYCDGNYYLVEENQHRLDFLSK